ncbi:MAG: MarR family transcriptional regulator [Pseudomonadota bacterium]
MSDEVPLSRRRLRTWLRLLRLTRSTENSLREFLRLRYDTTLPRFDVAAALYRAKSPMKMSDLSQMLLVSNGNATTVVTRLEKEGKVKRVTNEADKRVVHVDLTDEGRVWFIEIARAHEEQITEIFGSLGHEELDALRDLIHQIEDPSDSAFGGQELKAQG